MLVKLIDRVCMRMRLLSRVIHCNNVTTNN